MLLSASTVQKRLGGWEGAAGDGCSELIQTSSTIGDTMETNNDDDTSGWKSDTERAAKKRRRPSLPQSDSSALSSSFEEDDEEDSRSASIDAAPPGCDASLPPNSHLLYSRLQPMMPYGLQHVKAKPPQPFLPFGLPPHSHSLPELYPHALGAQGASAQARLGHLGANDVDGAPSQEVLPLYSNAAAAPSRLPAHKPVRLSQPKHPLAPSGTPVYFKYGEEHYPEETIPDAFTFTESDGTVCRYITNFLVYNKRGERLLPIEVLDQPRHGALVLYGSLLPASSVGSPLDNAGANGGRQGRSERRRSANGKGRRADDDGPPSHPPYPVRVELSEWCIDYGQEPQNVPFIWLISRWDVYYRLEKPAGRYIPTFATARMKFEVSTRVIKTLQFRPDFPYRELVDLLTAATRQERLKKRLRDRRLLKKETRRQRASQHLKAEMNLNYSPSRVDESADDCGVDAAYLEEEDLTSVVSRKKTARPTWKVHHSLSSPEGTGVPIQLPNGQAQPRTPWGAPFAVEGVRESTLLGLTDFLDSQMRNFLEGVGGAGGDCANLLETRFMQTLREKASLRRETLQLVEAKKRAIESMAAASAPFPHMAAAPSAYDMSTHSPLVALHVLQPIPVRHTLTPGTQVAQGGLLSTPMVTIGFAENGGCMANPHHHQALMMLKSRHQEEQELNQLLQLLKEFSEPEFVDGYNENDDASLPDQENLLDDSSEEASVSPKNENTSQRQRGRPPKKAAEDHQLGSRPPQTKKPRTLEDNSACALVS